MSLIATLGLYTLALFLLIAGVTHFTRPRFYTRLLPLWLPAHRLLVAITGLLEIALAIGLLLPATQSIAAWITIAMLVAYLLVHIHMLVDSDAGMGLPRWGLVVRLLAQFALIAWAYAYT